jgi:uncharacterized membrane protein
MRVVEEIEVSATPEGVWDHIADPSRYLHFLSGFTRWEVCSDEPTGVGARYRMLLRVGSAEVGGLVEVVEWDDHHEIAWNSITGIDQRGRWRIRERVPGRTKIEFRLAYGVAGSGLLGWVSEHLAAGQVRGHLRRSLLQLKRQVEHEELRKSAAARRAARAHPAA